MSTSGDSQPYLNDFMMRDDEDGVSGDDESDNKHSGGNYMLREQDRFLPICNIIKIMKVPVPENGKIAKDARECIQECVSEFISFITSEAIERSIAENRKTVNGDDLLYAFANLGFDNYVEPLSMYLHKFRESTKSDRNLYSETNMLQDDSSTEFPINADNSNTTIITTKAMTTHTGALTITTNAINHCTASVANTTNTSTDVKLFEIIEANQHQQQTHHQQQQQRQQNGIHSITITPTTTTSAVPLNLLSTGCNQTSPLTPVATSNTLNTTTLGSVRRSARLQTRPTQLPIVTTVANETPGAIMNADQMIFFDADELHQHVLQQQQQQHHVNGNNNYMHM
uniref:Nuclear transcription factor Y subunit beta n=2 Tax=Bactrocera latifrons TaxID=174628 RepID=A0A0K8VG09_BACLA